MRVSRRQAIVGALAVAVLVLLLVALVGELRSPGPRITAEIQPTDAFYVPSVVSYPDSTLVTVQLTSRAVDAIVQQVNAREDQQTARKAAELKATVILLYSAANVKPAYSSKVSLANPKWFWVVKPTWPRGFRIEFQLKVDGTDVTEEGSLTFGAGLDALTVLFRWIPVVIGTLGLFVLEEWIRRRWDRRDQGARAGLTTQSADTR